MKENKSGQALSKKERSSLAKQASQGKDIGKKGKMFSKVAELAAKEYDNVEVGKKVAAAAMIKSRARKT